MHTIKATNRPTTPQRPDRYTCTRCGITKSRNNSRPRPALCGDCEWVEAA